MTSEHWNFTILHSIFPLCKDKGSGTGEELRYIYYVNFKHGKTVLDFRVSVVPAKVMQGSRTQIPSSVL